MTPPDPASDRGRARACGLALLDASDAYEELEVDPERLDVATVFALVGVARRHLRAAYALTDLGLEMEAIPVRRALLEYALRIDWLLTDRQLNLKLWRWDDARTRLGIDEDAEDFPGDVLDAETRALLERTMAEIEADTADELKAKGLPLGVPSIKTLAKHAMPDVYVAYRYDSQFIHPSAIAAQQRITRMPPEGRLRVHDKEQLLERHVDTYPVCAWFLLGLLASIDQRFDPPLIEPGRLEAVWKELESFRQPTPQ